MGGLVRCEWAGDDPRMRAYHDDEWGVPSHDDAHLFEMLTLEGAQAGLSWQTILNKREGYRRAFVNFDAAKVSRFTPARVEKLMLDASIVRNRMKIESTIDNAKAIVALRREFASLDEYVWSWVDGAPLQPGFTALGDLPASTNLSKVISKDLKKRGFRFVGPTTVYAFMQSVGMTNDHVVSCFRHAQLAT